MIYIIEGTDLVGKTSLAKKMHEISDIPQTSIWIDLNQPKPAVISVSRTLRLLLKASKQEIIFDRSFLSEYVYGKVLGRETSYIEPLIEEWGELDGLLLIILTANEAVLRERYAKRGDNYVGIDQIIMANREYLSLSLLTSRFIKTIYLDSSSYAPEELAFKILGYCQNK